MACCYKYISPYVSIYWSKRFINYRPSSLRVNLKRLKDKNRIKKRFNMFQVKHKLWCLRNPFKPFQPQRRNYNTVYGHMQIPINTKELK